VAARSTAQSAATCLLRLWVLIAPAKWKSVCCVCCDLSGRVPSDGLITRPQESYRLWCVVVCYLETSWNGRSWPALGRSAIGKKIIFYKNNNAIIITYGRLQNLICSSKFPKAKGIISLKSIDNLGTRCQKGWPALISAISLCLIAQLAVTSLTRSQEYNKSCR